MTRVFLSVCLGMALVWATGACGSDDDKKKTSTNKICTNDDECNDPFFECEHVNSTTTGTCTKPCGDTAECPSGYSCQSGAAIGLEGSCLQFCADKSCPSGHTCITNADSARICVPEAWNAAS